MKEKQDQKVVLVYDLDIIFNHFFIDSITPNPTKTSQDLKFLNQTHNCFCPKITITNHDLKWVSTKAPTR